MKKIISFMLVLALTCTLGITGMAAGGMKNFTASRTYTGFTDVAEGAWYHGSVKAAFEYGLVKGSTPTTYNPTGTLTVAEAIVMADRIHMLYETGKDTLQNGTPWYQPYVDYAMQAGILTEGAFDSYTRNITRAEMADLFTRALPGKEYGLLNDIDEACPADVVGHKFAASIRTLYQAGVLTGNDPFGTFIPDANIIRSEAAAIVSRIVDPTLRKQVQLLEAWDYEHITVGIPYGALPTTPDAETADGGLELMHRDAGIMVYKTINATGGADGMTVLNVPRDVLGAELAKGLGISSVTGYELTFGSRPAYRFDFDMPAGDDDAAALTGSFYVYLKGSDMYMIAVMGIHDGSAEGAAAVRPLMADMVNSVKVEGHGPSIKLAK